MGHRSSEVLVALALMAVASSASETAAPSASARCEEWLSERHAIVAGVGRLYREGPRFAELGRQVRQHCLSEGIPPKVRARALLEEAESTDNIGMAQSEKRVLLEQARTLLEREAPVSREMILVLEQLADLSDEFSLDESEGLLEEALRLRAEAFGAESRKAMAGRHRLVGLLRFRGATMAAEKADLGAARAEAERFVQDSRARFGEGDPVTVIAWVDLAGILEKMEGSAAAERVLEEHVYPYGAALTTGQRLVLLLD